MLTISFNDKQFTIICRHKWKSDYIPCRGWGKFVFGLVLPSVNILQSWAEPSPSGHIHVKRMSNKQVAITFYVQSFFTQIYKRHGIVRGNNRWNKGPLDGPDTILEPKLYFTFFCISRGVSLKVRVLLISLANAAKACSAVWKYRLTISPEC